MTAVRSSLRLSQWVAPLVSTTSTVLPTMLLTCAGVAGAQLPNVPVASFDVVVSDSPPAAPPDTPPAEPPTSPVALS